MGAKNAWNETKQQARYEVLFGGDDKELHDAVVVAAQRLGYRSVPAYLVALARAVYLGEQGDMLLPILGVFQPMTAAPTTPARRRPASNMRPNDLSAMDALLGDDL